LTRDDSVQFRPDQRFGREGAGAPRLEDRQERDPQVYPVVPTA
jgi:hypothetical protein